MRTILLGLNEINFHFVEKYIALGYLPHFKQLFAEYGYTTTTSEQEYHLLEPWIQWVTVHTGKTYAEHQVFRLGDIINNPDLPQIFEILEKQGYRIGAVSPFNADNRLQNPAFFVADPWTQTISSGNCLLKALSKAVSQGVNDNAQQRLSLRTLCALVTGILYYTPIQDYPWYFKQLLNLKTVATKPIILDKLLSDIFLKEWKKTQPDFSLLFLNSGAHIQHHYLYNSKVYAGNLKNPQWYCPAEQDPLLRIYTLYDNILEKILTLPKTHLMIATGLSQQAHNELAFYWRLKDHTAFLNSLGINSFLAVHPRMSRDFLITFANVADAAHTEQQLLNWRSNEGIPLFTVDNRGDSLFVELAYSQDIPSEMTITNGLHTVPHFREHVAFVAIKNGEHNSTGFFLETKQNKNTMTFPLPQLFNLLYETVQKPE